MNKLEMIKLKLEATQECWEENKTDYNYGKIVALKQVIEILESEENDY